MLLQTVTQRSIKGPGFTKYRRRRTARAIHQGALAMEGWITPSAPTVCAPTVGAQGKKKATICTPPEVLPPSSIGSRSSHDRWRGATNCNCGKSDCGKQGIRYCKQALSYEAHPVAIYYASSIQWDTCDVRNDDFVKWHVAGKANWETTFGKFPEDISHGARPAERLMARFAAGNHL